MEKVCEFSGEYPGFLMYSYKRNHIQIMPKYRKKFKGAKAILHIFKPEVCCVYKSGGYSTASQRDFKSLKKNGVIKSSTFEGFLKEWYPGTKVKNKHEFCLKVEDISLQGEVQGNYFNSTFDLKDTIKRLKRMLQCREIKIIKHDCEVYDNDLLDYRIKL